MILNSCQGLYHGNGHPVFPEGMQIDTHNLAAAVKNWLRTPRLVIIEFILEDLIGIGATGDMLLLSLASNYAPGNRSNIHHEKISFDLKNDNTILQHKHSVSRTVQKLKDMCVFRPLPLVHANT